MLNIIERNSERESDDLVIFLHGFGGCAAQWRGMQRHFSLLVNTMAVDLPGHAGSLSVDWQSPKIAAQEVLDLVKSHDHKIHLVGHSMGGAVASLMALLAPDRISSLTLLAPGGFGPEIAHETLLRWANAKDAEDLEAIMPSFFADGFKIFPKIIDMQGELRNREGAVAGLVAIGHNLARDGKQGMLPLEELWKVPARIAVIWGEQDNILPVTQARSLQPMADNGRMHLHILKNVGHSPAEEATDLVRGVIMQMIENPI